MDKLSLLEWIAVLLFVCLLGLELLLLISGIWNWDRGYLDWRALLFSLGYGAVVAWIFWRKRK
jgi:hypothetical protein